MWVMRDSNVANAAKESAQNEFPHGLLDFCTLGGWSPTFPVPVWERLVCTQRADVPHDIKRVEGWRGSTRGGLLATLKAANKRRALPEQLGLGLLYWAAGEPQQRGRQMAKELEGKVAVVTGAASGIGLASTEAMLAAGSRVVMVDRDEAALKTLCKKYGNTLIPLVIDLLDPKDCATLLPRVLEKAGQLDILHANAGTYVGGDLVDADTVAIDRMLNLNVNVVIKNVHDVLPHMIERRTGDIIVTSSLAAHFPTPWEPVYASSKWAINCFVQTVRRQVFKHGIRVGSISPGPVISALLADWPPEKLKEAKESGSLLEASEVANVIMFMLTRPRGMTIRDVVMLPTNFDL
jgi:ribitol 2-dehydrogenase